MLQGSFGIFLKVTLITSDNRLLVYSVNTLGKVQGHESCGWNNQRFGKFTFAVRFI